MFRRGGPSFQAQGTGITSPFDTPRRGLVQYPGGYAGRTFEEIQADREAIFAPKEGEQFRDVIESFGEYSNVRNEDGSFKTTGEQGYEQAKNITALRKEREEKRQLAALTGLESEEAGLVREEEQAGKVSLAQLEGAIGKENALAVQALQNSGAIDVAKIQFDPARTATGLKIKELRDMFPVMPGKGRGAEYDRRLLDILAGTSSEKDISKIAAALIAQGHDPADAGRAAITVWMTIQAGLGLKKGGRVGYQMGTPDTGAMPIQASATETIDTPTADFTETETITEGQQGSVQMPYQEFRAAIPAEVSDDIVQLIYYNQDAFADFAQISTQADVYAFNNKYGVSLVLPMDTETT